MINIGNISISNLYVGTSHVSKVYVGEDQVWPVEPYVTFKALQNSSSIGLNRLSTNQSLEYSQDKINWSTFDTTVTVNLDQDEEVYIRGVLSGNNTTSDYTNFSMSGIIAASGNCNYLWNYSNPNASLKEYCGFHMFRNCTSLTTAPKLPATTLASNCYIGMFRDCNSLTTVPDLPSMSLAENCYSNMFNGCSALTTAPGLPATTLTVGCYAAMFAACSSLTNAPDLNANSLVTACYNRMFENCSSLNRIKCLATTGIGVDNSTTDWLHGVSSTGLFLTSDSSIWSSGDSGIPTGWTSQVPEYINYLTFDIIEGGDIVWKKYTVNKTIEYSINNGTWISLPATTDGAHITVAIGDEVRFRGNNTSYATSKSNYCAFEGVDQGLSGAKYNVRGNIMSLCYGDNFIGNDTLPANYTFCSLFKYSRVVSAKDLVLPALTMVPDCYRAMFSFAELLEEAPAIPATTTALECCWYMFESTIITKSPDLLTQVLAEKCYGNMFNNCAQLNSVKCLATDISAANCIQNWMTGVGAGGTFYRDGSLTWPRGTAGVPMSWTIVPSQS